MNDSKATSSPNQHTIRFDISTDLDRGVTILVDGEACFAEGERIAYVGFLPDELFSAHLPLIPTAPPRRVAVARCECGVPQCSNRTALIRYGGPDESQVVWTDFQDLGSGVSGVLEIEWDALAEHGERLPQPDLAFDRVEYEAAVLLASTDRTWETPSMETARLLEALLSTRAAEFRTLGFSLQWVSPSRTGDGWSVGLWSPGPRFTGARLSRTGEALRPWEHARRQVLAALSSTEETPVLQAADLYRRLMDTPLTDWESTFPHHHLR